MRIHTFKNYDEMSIASARLMVKIQQEKENANLCLASGGSPESTYEKFVQLMHNSDHSKMIITKLDEWCDIASDSPMSCERYLHERVLDPLNIDEKNYIAFHPDAIDYENECIMVHEALQNRPIDLCVLGLGRNGHLGLNEPDDYLMPYAHVAVLSETTKGHPMIAGTALKRGLTIGMAEIMASKRVLLQVSGIGKQSILDDLLSGKIDPHLPASFLWMHPHVDVYVCEDQFLIK